MEEWDMKKQQTFGVMVGTRGFFNPKLAEEGRKKLLAKLQKMGFNAVILPENATPTGAIQTIEDAHKCARLFNEKRYEIDGIVVSLPNFGDELGIANALNEAQLRVPILVHAEDDENDKVDVEHRRDAFCGKLSVCNNLYQYGFPFTDTTYHTCKVESDVFTRDLEFFSRVCRVVQGLTHARIGQVGARPVDFNTVRASEKLLQATGITVVPVDLSEMFAAALKLKDDEKPVKDKVSEMREYGSIPGEIPDANVLRNAKFCVALDRWIEENNINACAVQCWTSIQENYGCAACTAMSMLGERLIPSACEVDIAGAVSMYTLSLASGNPSALTDWNNNFGEDREMCVVTHCSNYPKGFIVNPIEISNLDILGASVGYDRSFGAIKGKIAAGSMTYFRMDTDDTAGQVRAYLGEGEFTDDPYGMAGGIGVCRVPNLQQLMKFMCKKGFEHHVAMVRSQCADVIEEAVDTYLGWDLYCHS
jgi:L-fucose isomerase-like protein